MTFRRTVLVRGAALAAASFLPAGASRAQASQPVPFELPEHLRPTMVRVRRDLAPGQILVLTGRHHLYLVLEDHQALRYGVGVGREGLNFRGQAVVGRKAEWPSWRPTPEMIARNPARYARYADGMPGGPGNPLGARALYLYQNGNDTAFRIHGTTEPESIGQSVSNGCIRMLNDHVIDLYARVDIGTPVTVY